MKGMLSKAFSIALLISVVPSFSMDSSVDTKHVAEQVAHASNATPTRLSWYDWVMGKLTPAAVESPGAYFNKLNAAPFVDKTAEALQAPMAKTVQAVAPVAQAVNAGDVISGAKFPKSPVENARELSEKYGSVKPVATTLSSSLDKVKAFGSSIANSKPVAYVTDKVKAAGNYVKDTRVAGYVASAANKAAGYAKSAVTVPYDYTVGALANKSGLTNVGFVKNDKFYNATIGKFAAQAAITAALAYGTYRAGKAAVNYFRPVQSTHAQVNQALEALYSKLASGEDLVNSKEAKALARLSFMQMAWNNIDKKTVSLKEALKVNPKAKSYIQIINGHLIDLANDKLISVPKDREEVLKFFKQCISTMKGCSKAFHDTLLVVAQPAPKAVVVAPQAVVTAPQVPSTWRTKAYNMIKNKYTLGAVAALGAGAAYVYKKRASVVNPMDSDLVGASVSML